MSKSLRAFTDRFRGRHSTPSDHDQDESDDDAPRHPHKYGDEHLESAPVAKPKDSPVDPEYVSTSSKIFPTRNKHAVMSESAPAAMGLSKKGQKSSSPREDSRGSSKVTHDEEDPWRHADFSSHQTWIAEVDAGALRTHSAARGLVSKEQTRSLERIAPRGNAAHNMRLLQFLQAGGTGSYVLFLKVLSDIGYMHQRREMEKLLPSRYRTPPLDHVPSRAEFAVRRAELAETLPGRGRADSSPSREPREDTSTSSSAEPPPTASRGRSKKAGRTSEEHTERAKKFGLIRDDLPQKGTSSTVSAAPGGATSSPPEVATQHQPQARAKQRAKRETPTSRSPLLEPLSEHGIAWLADKCGSLRSESLEKWWTTLLPKWLLPKSDQEEVAAILTDTEKSGKKKVNIIIRMLVAYHGDSITNTAILDSLQECGPVLQAVKLQFKGYVSAIHTTSRLEMGGSAKTIQPVPKDQRPADICGLKRRQISLLCELLNAETNPRIPNNWRHLARALHDDYRPVPNEFRLASNPTLELLLHWDRYHHGDIETLREKLTSIRRTDCLKCVPLPFQLASTAATDTGQVHKGDIMLSDLAMGTIEELSRVLYRKSHSQNWFALGLCLKVPMQILHTFEKEGSSAPQKLIVHLAGHVHTKGVLVKKRSPCSVSEFYRALLAIDRPDVAELFDRLIPEKSLKSLHVDPSLPEVMLQPTACDVPLGSAATLLCLGCGYPAIRYQWLCNGTPWIGATQHRFVTHRPGSYCCRVSNDLSSVLSRVVEVSQSAPDEITSQGAAAMQTYTIALGEGSICTNRVRVMVVGQDRTGKSSLIRSLLKKVFEASDSTVGIDIATATFAIASGAADLDDIDLADACLFLEDARGGEGFCQGEVARAVATHLHSKQQQEQLKATESEDSAVGNAELVVMSAEELMERTRAESMSANPTTDDADAEASDHDDHGLVRQGAISGEFGSVPGNDTLTDSTDGGGEADVFPSDSPDVPQDAATAAVAPEGDGQAELARTESIEMTPELQKMVTKLLEEVQVDTSSEQVLVRIYDFAGQPVYYNTHSVFMSSTGVYLLVHNTARDLQGNAEVRFSEDGHERVIDKDEFLSTNLDYLYSWMSAVYTATGQVQQQQQQGDQAALGLDDSSAGEAAGKGYSDPPVLVVGTHRDELAKRGHHELARAIINKSEELDKHLGSKAYGAHLSRPYFFVDNSVSGSGAEDHEVALLRQSIRRHAMRQPGTRHRVPIKWVKCELLVEKLVEREHVTHLSFKDFQAMAAKVEIRDAATLKTMLEFYNKLGVLVYFSNTPQLSDLVILDPQWLANVFKQLITVPPLDELNPQQAAWWKCVTETGILHPDLIKDIWSDDKLRKQRSKLLAIMAKFDLVCPFHTNFRAEGSASKDRDQSRLSSSNLLETAHLEYDDPSDDDDNDSPGKNAEPADAGSAAASATPSAPADSSTAAATSWVEDDTESVYEAGITGGSEAALAEQATSTDTAAAAAAAVANEGETPAAVPGGASASSAAKQLADDVTTSETLVAYMVPSLLRAEPPDTAFYKLSRHDPAPMCLLSAIGFVPEAFFYRLVARSVARYPVCPELYRRFARLHIDREYDLLVFFRSACVELVVQAAAAAGGGEDVRASDAARCERLKACCSDLIRCVLSDASEVTRQGMRGLVFSLATTVRWHGADRRAYLTEDVCAEHSAPLPACAEYACRGCVVPRVKEERCVRLPANLRLVSADGPGMSTGDGDFAPLPNGLHYWFPETAVVQIPEKLNSEDFKENYTCPKIIEQPKDTEVRTGGTLSLCCLAHGYPKPKYQWRKGGQDLKGMTSAILKMPKFSVSTGSFHGFSMFNCLVQNDAGYLFSRTAVVKCLPEGHPVVTKQLESRVDTTYCSEVFLSIKADGEDLHYQWYFYDIAIPGMTEATLHIRRVYDWDEGQYLCKVENSYGVAHSTICHLYLVGKVGFDLSTSQRERAQRDAEHSKEVKAKVALLIGNRDYTHQRRLIHPESDVLAIGHALEDHGFRTLVYVNLTFREMIDAIKCFLKMLSAGTYALFYYAGHGLEDGANNNYLVPVDLDTSNNLRKCIRLSAIHFEMQRKSTRLVAMVLDCCRTSAKLTAKQTPRCKVPLEGFANYAYHFSCCSSGTALESKSDANSVYAMSFLKELRNCEQMKIEDFFSRVAGGVMEANARDKKSGSGAAMRPELLNGLASATGLKWTDEINTESNKQYHRVLKNHNLLLCVPSPAHLECEELATSVKICFFRRVTNVLVVTCLVDKNCRDSVAAKFDVKFVRAQNLVVCTVDRAPPFLKHMAQLCCSSHDTVLFICGLQTLRNDIRLRMAVRTVTTSGASVKLLEHTVKRDDLGPMCTARTL